mgnify:CR=1 FL=1
MQSLFVLYSALAVFGLGVMVVDLFGAFDQGASSDGGEADGTADAGDAADALDDGGTEGETGPDGDEDAAEPAAEPEAPAASQAARGSLVVGGQKGVRAVAKLIGTLRIGVYFSLGAGPTGLFALLTGVAPAASLAWASGAGAFIAVLVKALRSFARRDLDSTVGQEEYLMDEAAVTVPVAPGAMGRVLVRRYGREAELYVRCKDPKAGLSKGARVRIVDLDEGFYWVEELA